MLCVDEAMSRTDSTSHRSASAHFEGGESLSRTLIGNSSSGGQSPATDDAARQQEYLRVVSAIGSIPSVVDDARVGDARQSASLVSPRMQAAPSIISAKSALQGAGAATEVDNWLGGIGSGMSQYSAIFHRNAIHALDILAERQFPAEFQHPLVSRQIPASS